MDPLTDAMQSKIKDVKELKKDSDASGKGDEKNKPVAEQSSTIKKKTSVVKGMKVEKLKITDKKPTTSVEKSSPEIKEKVVYKTMPPTALAPVKGKMANVTERRSPTNIIPTVEKKLPTNQKEVAEIKPPVVPSLAAPNETSVTAKEKGVEKKKLPPKEPTQANGDNAKRKMAEVHDHKSKVQKTSPKGPENKELSLQQATQAKVEKTLPGVTEKEAEKPKLHQVRSLTSLVKEKMRERICSKTSTTNIKPPKKTTETEVEKTKSHPKETTETIGDNVPRLTSPVKQKMGTKTPHRSSNVYIKPPKKITETGAEKPKPPQKVPSVTSLVKEKMRERISPDTFTTNINPPEKTTEANSDNVTKKPLKEVGGSGTSSANKDDERVNTDSDSLGYSTETSRPITSIDVKKNQNKVRSLSSLVKEKMRERILSAKSSRTNIKSPKKTTDDDSDDKSDNDNATETLMPIIDESYSEDDNAGDEGSLGNKGENIVDEASSFSIDTKLFEDENEDHDDVLANFPGDDEDGPVSSYVDQQHMGFQTGEFNAPCLLTILEENEISSGTGKEIDTNQETAQDKPVPEMSGSSSEIQAQFSPEDKYSK